MSEHVHANAALTKNQSLVKNVLDQSEGPLSAYNILHELRDHGFRAPLQVYRALDKLVEFGLVHRLESLNAFVACSHPDCEGHETIAFMICELCEQVDEISDSTLSKQLIFLADDAGFALKNSTIELRGTCKNCRAA